MRVFVTGATGFIGSATVRDLLAAGHQVLGLARNEAAASALATVGVDVHRGELTDIDSLVAGARRCDGVIHTAFIHDFSAHAAACETDRLAVTAMADALAGTDKPFVIASGTALLAPGQLAVETAVAFTGAGGSLRAAAETIMLAAAGRGVRTSVVRLSPSVHGAGDHGFVPILIDFARRAGFAAYVGDGANRWPAVHRLDAARLFRLALEKAAPGARLHAAAEEGIPMRRIAETIGQGIGVPTRSLTGEAVQVHFDWMARFIGIDNPTSSALTQSAMGWRPTGPDLLTDMRENGYFG